MNSKAFRSIRAHYLPLRRGVYVTEDCPGPTDSPAIPKTVSTDMNYSWNASGHINSGYTKVKNRVEDRIIPIDAIRN